MKIMQIKFFTKTPLPIKEIFQKFVDHGKNPINIKQNNTILVKSVQTEMLDLKIDLVAVFIFMSTVSLCTSTTDVLYVPMIDKICVLEKLNQSRLLFEKEIIFSAVTTFPHCIVNSNVTINEGEMEEIIYANGTTLLEPVHEECSVERFSFNASRSAKRTGAMFYCTHLEICISYCRMTISPVVCNAVLFSQSEGICTLLNYEGERQNKGNLEKNFISEFFVLYDCRYAAEAAVESELLGLDNYTISEHYHSQIKLYSSTRVISCEIYRLPFVEKFLSMRVSLWLTNIFKECLQLCIFANSTNEKCNSVYYSKKMGTCLILNIANESDVRMENTSSDSTPFLYYISNCTENDRSLDLSFDYETDSAPEYSDGELEYHLDEIVHENYNVETSLSFVIGNTILEQDIINSSAMRIVKFYDFMEICITEKLNFELLEYAVASEVAKRCWSLNSCLLTCRSSVLRTGCRGVLFSRQNSRCHLLHVGDIFDHVIVNPEDEVVRLISCKKEDERTNNPEPLRYYIEEMHQVCQIELYISSVLSSWIPISTIEDVDNFQKCLKFCATHKQCSAFNFSNVKLCTLLESGSVNNMYNKPNNSVFAEVLYCEPGTVIDLIY
ncbi:hypothetical protein T12_15752 [Trichinella patagoniensis]|uniref:Apple domain-containing protein n=1 Tax=Trichinella patagoniensis TaxID=990121 RepID=A0A0V1ADL5_9BILA|nr:hypothetical protein T12_15752 [Trichinella patagoniensis]